jgi:hypothetical protein
MSTDLLPPRPVVHLELHTPDQVQASAAALGDSELRQIVSRFADAWECNDVDAVVAMLAEPPA